MWIYRQRTGELLRSGKLVTQGYSGSGVCKNDPLAQHLTGIGPIPQGVYLIGEARDSETHGPLTMHLIPVTGTQTYGRSAFLIHGDSISSPGSASHGCIILPRAIREEMAKSGDPQLVVLGDLP